MNSKWIASVLAVTLMFSNAAFGKTEKQSKEPAAPGSLSVEDLGFSNTDLLSDPQYQKDLNARSDMLKIHQILGMITVVPMTTTFVLGLSTADSVSHGSTDVGLHAALGLSTVALYGTTACFAIFAPKPKGLKPSGASEIHQILAWIHFPLMIITPLLGDMVADRVANHQPIGDLGALHGIAAGTLMASYLASMTVMTINF
jgi:hypothetical protein